MPANFTYQFQWHPETVSPTTSAHKLSGPASIHKLYNNLEREEVMTCKLTIEPSSFHMEDIQSLVRLNNDQGNSTEVARAFKLWANGIYQGWTWRADCWANW